MDRVNHRDESPYMTLGAAHAGEHAVLSRFSMASLDMFRSRRGIQHFNFRATLEEGAILKDGARVKLQIDSNALSEPEKDMLELWPNRRFKRPEEVSDEVIINLVHPFEGEEIIHYNDMITISRISNPNSKLAWAPGTGLFFSETESLVLTLKRE